jgi:hypothetical protein
MNVARFKINLDVSDERFSVPNQIEDFVVAVLSDEVVSEIYNILSHFYLLSRDFPSPLWIAISETSDISQYEPEKGPLTAQREVPPLILVL